MTEIQFGARRKNARFRNELVNQLIGTKTTKLSIQIPESVNMKFREDYNIWSLHEIIMEKIKQESQSNTMYDLMINGTKLAISLCECDSERRKLENQLAKYNEDKQSLCGQNRLDEYKLKALPLLDAYNRIPKTENHIQLNNDSSKHYYPTENDLSRIKIIRQYANLASNYIVVNYTCTGEKPSNISNLCLNCGTDLSKQVSQNNLIEYCPVCSHKCNVGKIIKKIGRCDVDEYKPTGTCNELGNFTKAMNHYQGNIKLTKYRIEDITQALDKYFRDERCMIGEEIKLTRSLNAKGQREGTSVEMMHAAMQALKIDCYNYINYICREYWGWVLPNISHLHDVLISDYMKTQAVRATLSIDERGGKSNIPVRLRLCEHLIKRGWNCSRSDFKLPNDIEKYLPGWEIMCRKSGVPELMGN